MPHVRKTLATPTRSVQEMDRALEASRFLLPMEASVLKLLVLMSNVRRSIPFPLEQNVSFVRVLFRKWFVKVRLIRVSRVPVIFRPDNVSFLPLVPI